MKRIANNLSQRFTGGNAANAARPILAGYRREMAPGWRLVFLIALALVALAYGVAFGYMAPARMMPLVAPIALLCCLVIWVLPAGDYAPTPLLEPLFMAFFAALVLWPNYVAIGLPGLPWVTLLRLIGTPMVVALLVCISVSSFFRSRLWDVLKSQKTILWLLVGVVVMQTLTLPLSRDLGLSLNRWIVAQVNWTAILIIACIVFIRPGFAEYWVRVLIAMMFVLCAFALWEQQVGRVPWSGYIPEFLKIDDPHVQRLLQGGSRAATGIYRIQGTSTTPLGFAELLGISIPFALHIIINRNNIIVRFIGFIYIPLCIYIILLTDSRLGLVAALASILFYLLFWAIYSWRSYKNNLIGPAIVFAYPVIFVAAIASTFLVRRLRNEVWGDGSTQASTDSRIAQWVMGLPKVASNPLGHGIGQSGEVLGFRNPSGTPTIDSYYLSILLEIGVVGFIFYYGMFILSVVVAIKNVEFGKQDSEILLLIPFSVSIINFIVVKSVLSQDANHPIVFMMVGAIIALSYRANLIRIDKN